MKRLLLVLLLLAFPLCARADRLSMENVSYIPLLQDGRIKPIDSFARVMLARIHGSSSLPDASAVQWLCSVLFTPQEAMRQKIFSITSPELPRMLSLPPRVDNLYSFEELAPVFTAREALVKHIMGEDKKSLSGPQRGLLALYGNVTDFAQLAGSLTSLMPLPSLDIKLLALPGLPPGGDRDYLSVLRVRQELHRQLAAVVQRKHDRIETYSPREQALLMLSYRLDTLEAIGKNNNLFRIIPPVWNGDDQWRAPWSVVGDGAGSPRTAALFAAWRKLAAAYQNSDAAAWDQESAFLRAEASRYPGVRPSALGLEVAYNKLHLLDQSLFLYGIGFALVLIGTMRSGRGWLPAAYRVLLAGAALHGAALCMRMFILLRPPVSTLYESMIFVSFVTIMFALWLERKRRSGEVMALGAAVAALLLAAAHVFAAGNDTLEVLVAVLNTNFWLATHVVCITTGYGSCLVAAALAHLYLLRYASGTASLETLASLQRLLYRTALVALLFTAVGTMLGGIWADQSWGRFWGWDPKENGALWIVLWLLWLLHGRVAGQLREWGFAVGMACLGMVVALAWVGVNLLSVGLHSYGFTDTAASGLAGFCAVEAAFIVGVMLFVFWKGRKLHA